ncbi:LysR substrate-binding domain-containing protein [Thioalbus denitrificans]|uniref:LysR family transcriptional regulator n=1 Tax=Thioalbus denitrificans TaxID=547122 RepID=A0A369CHF4_9GAMM|nr:LysR family transcriptional regulator [Thioalbus denitrificans]RCX31274.1 LysR family transcriptional regulator [Thioalbus denitrificans]
MDIELLRTFLELQRTRHFARAAERLHLTQSAVSARIRLLEETLGQQLFTRKRNDIRLTAAGTRLLKHAETIVGAWSRARQESGLGPEYRTSLALGGAYDLWESLLRGWLCRLREQLPDIALQAETLPGELLLRRLLDGVLDIAVLFEPPRLPGETVREVGTVNLVLVSSVEGAGAMEALGEGFVRVDWGASTALELARRYPDLPTPSLRMSHGTLALGFILERGGAAYLPERLAEPHLAAGRLHRVADAAPIERPAYAVYRPGSEREEVIRQALALLDGA